MNRKLCKISRGRNASARCRRRSYGQMYRVVTTPHTMKLKAILTKKSSRDCMTVLLLELQRLSAASDRRMGFVAPRRRGLCGVGDRVLAPPNLGLGRELRLRRERTA